jgi:hypothetical protein
MMTAKQYRAQAELMDRAMEDSSDSAVILDCQRMAVQWRRLAAVADWQDTMLENPAD